MNNKDLLFRYNDTDYKILVSESESGSIKLSMKNTQTKDIEEITVGDLRGETPDCVIVKNDEKLIDRLLQVKILDSCNGIFARINVSELYKYDQKNVKAFIDKHATRISYRKDKGNTEDEIRKNIRKDAREIFNNKEIKEFFDDHLINMNYFMYSVLDKDNIKESFAVFCDENEEFVAVVKPYRDNINTQLDIIRDYQYSEDYGFFSPLNNNCQIIQVNKNSHAWIMEGLESNYPDFEYKKGVQKYLRYCISKRVDKEEYMKDFKDMSKMMKKEKMKLRER